MKIVSIDIETTGLDAYEDQILEVGLVAYDTEKPFTQSPANSLRILLIRDSIAGNLFALNLNAGILKEMLDTKERMKNSPCKNFLAEEKDNMTVVYLNCTVEPELGTPCVEDRFKDTIVEFLTSNDCYVAEKYEKTPKITVAGKNYAMFDHKFLMADPITRFLAEKVRHRVFDVGAIFTLPEDKTIPNLKTCCERAGLANTTVTHYSVDDAVMVVLCAEAYFNRAFPDRAFTKAFGMGNQVGAGI